MKTLIAIPCMDMTPTGFVQSFVYLEKGEDVNVCFSKNSLVYDSRNLLSLTAIENGFDRVLWLDSDMMFTPDTLKKLHADMDNIPDAQIVSGLYVKRNSSMLPVIYDELAEPDMDKDGKVIKHIHEFMDYPRDDIFPVKGCGFGCCLTSVKLLKDVWDRFGPAFTPLPWAGEDISFCHRVNQLGYTIYCDSSVSCGHIGTYVYYDHRLGGDAH